MFQVIEAIYKDGQIRPLDRLDLEQHQRVWLAVLSAFQEASLLEEIEPELPTTEERITLVQAHAGIVAVSDPEWADWVSLEDEVLEENW